MKKCRYLISTIVAGTAALLATNAVAQTTIRVSYSPATYKELYQDLADRFMQSHPDIKVKLDAGADSYDTLVQQTIRASITGEMPDISFQGLNQIRTLSERGLAVPLNAFMAKENDWEGQGYSPSITNLATYGGNTYGLPFGISLPVMFYNADLVKQAGGDPDNLPTTWDEIIALSKKIDSLGPNVSGLYVEYTNNSWSFQTFVGGFGGKMVNSDETKVAFDGAAGLEAMTLLHRLNEVGQPPFERNQARQAFDAGTLGILSTASSALSLHVNAAKGHFTVKVGPYPQSNDSALFPAAGNGVVMLAKDSAKQDAAWEYIKFATGPAGQNVMLTHTGYSSVNTKVLNDPKTVETFYSGNPEFVRATMPLMSRLTGWYSFSKNNSEIIKAIEDACYLVVTGKAEPKVQLEELAGKVNGLMQ